MTTGASKGYAIRIAPPSATGRSLGRSPGRRTALPPSAPPPVPQLLQGVDEAFALLRARGFPVGTQLLAERYARLLSREGLDLIEGQDEDLHPSEDRRRPRAGYHDRDRAGSRYWIVGRQRVIGRDDTGLPGVVVPGVPGRAFDRIVLTRFDAAFGVEFAGSARAHAFLKAAEYEEESNEWFLDADHSFWFGSEVEDLTARFRLTAGRIDHAPSGESSAIRMASSTEASTTRAMNR